MDLRSFIKDVPDYPKPGVVYKDITPLLSDGEAFRFLIDEFTKIAEQKNPDLILGIDARGFLLAAPIAYKLGKGVAIVRKPGKLPRETAKESYDLEYGSNSLEIHKDAIKPGQRVLIVDDVLATGGTVEAACRLVRSLGGEIVGIEFLIELTFLNGRNKITGYDIFSLISY